jgi:hypothetical protein
LAPKIQARFTLQEHVAALKEACSGGRDGKVGVDSNVDAELQIMSVCLFVLSFAR